MSRRDKHKVVRLAAGIYLALQARPDDVLAELYSDARHDQAPRLVACMAIEDAHQVGMVDDGTGLDFGGMHIVLPEAIAAQLHAWVVDRLPVPEVA